MGAQLAPNIIEVLIKVLMHLAPVLAGISHLHEFSIADWNLPAFDKGLDQFVLDGGKVDTETTIKDQCPLLIVAGDTMGSNDEIIP